MFSGMAQIADPDCLAQKHDANADNVLFVRLREADCKSASFLCDGILAQGMEQFWSPRANATAETGLLGGAEIIP